MHNCLMCRHSEWDSNGPITPFTSKELCWGFVCKSSKYSLWYSVNYGTVWIDGDSEVNRSGCKNYDRKFGVNVFSDYFKEEK